MGLEITPDAMSGWRAGYANHKSNAASRGIPFLLTFQEWLDAWGENIALRGVGKDALAMCRYMDRGPYAVGNVYIATNSQNGHDVKLHNRYNHPRGTRRVSEDSSRKVSPIAPGSEAMRTPPDELVDDLRYAQRLEAIIEGEALRALRFDKRGKLGPKVRTRTYTQPGEPGYSTARHVYAAIRAGRPFSLVKKARQEAS